MVELVRAARELEEGGGKGCHGVFRRGRWYERRERSLGGGDCSVLGRIRMSRIVVKGLQGFSLSVVAELV